MFRRMLAVLTGENMRSRTISPQDSLRDPLPLWYRKHRNKENLFLEIERFSGSAKG